MTSDTYVPTREDRFSFGIWTVGWQGVDVFGGAVRPPMAADRAVRKLAELGAYGVNFHDNDVFDFDASPAERDERISAFRKALEETGPGGHDGDHEPVRPPDVQGRRVHRQRARGAPVRAGEGDAQPRPGRRARREDLRVLGRPGGRGVGRGEGRPGGARPVRRGPEPAVASTSSTRATTSGSRSSPSRTSRAATSCCRPSGTRWPSSTRSSTRRWSASTPRSGTRRWPSLNYAHGIAQALWHGKLFHIDLNGQHGPRYDQDLRFGAGNARGAFWVVDTLLAGGYDGPVHFDFKPPRTEDDDGVWASAAACMRNYLILREKARAFRADPEVQAALRRRPHPRAGRADARRRGRPGATCATSTVDTEALGAPRHGLRAPGPAGPRPPVRRQIAAPRGTPPRRRPDPLPGRRRGITPARRGTSAGSAASGSGRGAGRRRRPAARSAWSS